MFNKTLRFLTKQGTEIPFFYCTLNLDKYEKDGEKGSCTVRVHPKFKNDEHIKKSVNDIIDYIRENYDMKDIL